jgi:predicted O-linked N-acetylglucosamine transferase (SPINDLY family)
VELISRAVAANSGNALAFNNLGCAQARIDDHEAAIASYDHAIGLDANYADAYNNRGNSMHALARYEAALASYERAIELKPDFADAFYNCGVTLADLGRYERAIGSYQHAIALKSDYPVAYNNIGVALADLRRYEPALASYEQAIALDPHYADAYSNQGSALQKLHRYEAAVASYERAIALQPQSPGAYTNLGAALAGLKRYDAALAIYERAIALDPAYGDAHYNLALALAKLGRHEAAVASYERTIALKPEIRFLLGMLLLARMQLCDWRALASDRARLRALIARGEPATGPFALLVVADEPALQLQCARIFVRERFPPDPALGPNPKRSRSGRIRIGYFSADFHNHATLYLMAGLFEMHDRSRFECTAFSFGAHSQDAMRARLRSACEHFLDVSERTDRQIALIARERQIDIAVDLKGFTDDCRTGIFALRAAPLQVAYLGYPGTMGAPYIDYLIADPTLVPEHSRPHYSEKIIYLPDSYQINDRERLIAAHRYTREECALPTAGFVFCCFNNCYKITPETFQSWLRLLGRIEHSVLWLLQDNALATRNLQHAAAQCGLDPERLIFAPRLPLPEHLARHSLADLFLDTLPCNAHTTASDALWAGLPVLTCAGKGFAARVAASLLQAVGLPELIARSPAHYEQLASEIVSQPQRLVQLRERLANARVTAPLFNTALTTRHIESAYSMIYERYLADGSPEHIFVQA